jgi:1-acyl-sn-glycerol-3-phosphate acyltransferase
MEADVKNGAAMIAIKAKATIFPCCVKTKKNRFSFFRRIDVYYGKPIKFEELGYDPEAKGEYTRVSKLMFDRIVELYEKEDAACE